MSRSRVIFTPLAERQLNGLYDFVAANASEETADRYVSRLLSHCERLRDFPLRGTQRDDVLPGLRTIGFERRVTIAFVVGDDTVLIEASSMAVRISRRSCADSLLHYGLRMAPSRN